MSAGARWKQFPNNFFCFSPHREYLYTLHAVGVMSLLLYQGYICIHTDRVQVTSELVRIMYFVNFFPVSQNGGHFSNVVKDSTRCEISE